MIYNEYAQVLEATNPATGELYQPEDLNVIDYNEVGTAMLQDAIFAGWHGSPRKGTRTWPLASSAPLSAAGFSAGRTSECIQYTVDAGSTLPAGHQRWMMNEICR